MLYDDNNKPMGVVYYVHLRQMARQRLRERIGQIDRKIDETRKDIEYLQEIDTALAQIEHILQRMRETAAAAALEGADIKRLSKKFERFKAEIDDIASIIPDAQSISEIKELADNFKLSI